MEITSSTDMALKCVEYAEMMQKLDDNYGYIVLDV